MTYEIVRYFFQLSPIFEIIENNKFKTVTFYLDVPSISYGIYSSRVIKNNFFLNYKDCWFDEIISYIDWLRERFKKYEPLFILFYDRGAYEYHLSIYPDYKQNRNELEYLTVDKNFSIDLKNGIQFLKQYTYKRLLELNNENDIISVYLDKEEADIVPHYFIKENFLDVQDNENLNLILSSDKDLFQSLKIKPKNIFQIVKRKKSGKFYTEIISHRAALEKLIKKEISEDLKEFYNSNWISYFLSVGGDKSDNIPSIPKIGYKTFFNLLLKNEVKIPDWDLIFEKIEKLNNYRKIILKNFKLVDFDKILKNEKISKYLFAKINKLL